MSVYSQQEFEEGVMRKLDEQVSRHTKQQAQAFAEKELRDVQQAIRYDSLSLSLSLSRSLLDVHRG